MKRTAEKIKYVVVALIATTLLMGATYVIHQPPVMHQSQDIYSVLGVPVATELGTIEAKLSEHGTAIDSIETVVTGYVTKAYVDGTDEILSSKIGSVEIALSSTGDIPVRIDSIETNISKDGVKRVYANTDGAYSSGPNIAIKQGANITVVRDGGTFEISGAAAPSAILRMYGDSDSVGTSGNYVTLQAGTGTTVVRTGDSIEISATATGGVTKIYGSSPDDVGSAGAITIKGGTGVTAVRTGGTVEIAATGSGGQSPYTAIVDAAGGGDYTTLAAAMNTLAAGATVFVKDGTYNETTAIKLETGDAIIGQSPGGVIIDFDGSDTSDGIYAVGGSGTELVDIWLKNLVVRDSACGTGAVYLKYCDYSKLENITIKDCDFTDVEGLNMSNCDYSILKIDCITNTKAQNFYYGTCNSGEIVINRLSGSSDSAGAVFNLSNGNDIKINSMDSFKYYGFLLANSDKNRINITSATNCQGKAVYLTYASSNEVTVNYIKTLSESVYLSNANDNTINIGEATTTGAYSTINISSGDYNTLNLGRISGYYTPNSNYAIYSNGRNFIKCSNVKCSSFGVFLAGYSSAEIQDITNIAQNTNSYGINVGGRCFVNVGRVFGSFKYNVATEGLFSVINVGQVYNTYNDSAARCVYVSGIAEGNVITTGAVYCTTGTYEYEFASSSNTRNVLNGDIGDCDFNNCTYTVWNGLADSVTDTGGTGYKANGQVY